MEKGFYDPNKVPQYEGEPRKKSNAVLIVVISAAVLILGILGLVISLLLGKNNGKGVDSSVNIKPETKTETTAPKTEEKKVLPLSEYEVKGFVNEWASAQSDKNISKYILLYADDFHGVKRTKSGRTYDYNYSGWVADRTKMYSGNKYISVTVDKIKISNLNSPEGTAEVTFYQYFNSYQYNTTKSYSDEGQKVLKIRKEQNGDIKIFFEELVYSTETFGGD
jgi:hypothetical protein